MKLRILFSVLFIFSSTQFAAELQNIATTQVGPGTVYKHFVAPAVPWNVEVLEIDLSNPFLAIETIKGDDALYGYERTSSMAARNDWDGHYVVGAVNGDFYGSGGVPINSQILAGELLRTPIEYSTIGFDINNLPLISRVSYNGAVFANDTSIFINNINMDRNENQLLFYNSYMGTNSGTNQWGKELLIAPLTSWIVNDTVFCLVEKVEDYVGSMAIPKGKAVLSAHGTSIPFFTENVQAGDTIRVLLSLRPQLDSLKAMVGGFPKIVKDGQNYALQGYDEEGGHSSFATDYHPRTAVGYTADGSKLIFVVVDGRQEGFSRGMSLPELADFLISLGAQTAINLDGGGSSTLVVRNAIKNSPSDGGERSVSNSLQVISSASKGALSSIQMEPDDYRLFKGDELGFSVSGWDEFYNPASVNNGDVTLSVDSSLGYINPDGKFVATQNGGDGYVFSHYNGMKDSAHVHIKEIKTISLNPSFCVADTITPLQFSVTAIDEDGIKQSLPLNNFIWRNTNEEIGLLDTLGLFKGRTEGSTQIIAGYADLTDTATVRVEIGTGKSLLDSLDRLYGWQVSGENIDTLATVMSVVDSPRTFGAKAIRVDYSFTRLSTERSTLHLNTDIPVYGAPELISFDFKSDGKKHKAYVIVSDNNDEMFKSQISGYWKDATKYDTLNAKTISFRAMEGGSFNYPIRIKSIWIKLGYTGSVGDVNSGTIYFDNLRVQYPEVTSIFPLINGALPRKAELYQNYPNPFNPTTTIVFQTKQSGPVKLEVFDIQGRKIDTLLSRELTAGYHTLIWDASGQASGVYIYRLEHGRDTFSRKMILLK